MSNLLWVLFVKVVFPWLLQPLSWFPMTHFSRNVTEFAACIWESAPPLGSISNRYRSDDVDSRVLVTRACPRIWVKTHLPPSAAHMRRWTRSAMVQVMACPLFGVKPLPEPMLTYCQLDPKEQTSVKFESKYKIFRSRQSIWKCRQRNGRHFVLCGMSQPLWFWDRNILGQLVQYHGCWCPDSLRRHGIGSHNIDCVG